MRRAAAVVINRNTRDLLIECLESLADQDIAGGISVWVVDNGSSDGSPAEVLRHFSEANLIWNDRNAGYAKACNQGIKNSIEPYIIIMNSDTVLSPGTASTLVAFLEQNPEVGVAAPRILNPDGSIQYSVRDFPGLKTAFMHAFAGLIRSDNPYSASYKKTAWDHDSKAEVDWVSGACMALRRKAVEEVGGFDEGYFMYVEDVDLCWRMREAGWRVVYLPGGDVLHHVGMSSRAATTRMLFHHHRSMLRFHRKTYRGPARRSVNALVALGVIARFALIISLNALNRLKGALGGPKRTIAPGDQ